MSVQNLWPLPISTRPSGCYLTLFARSLPCPHFTPSSGVRDNFCVQQHCKILLSYCTDPIMHILRTCALFTSLALGAKAHDDQTGVFKVFGGATAFAGLRARWNLDHRALSALAQRDTFSLEGRQTTDLHQTCGPNSTTPNCPAGWCCSQTVRADFLSSEINH